MLNKLGKQGGKIFMSHTNIAIFVTEHLKQHPLELTCKDKQEA